MKTSAARAVSLAHSQKMYDAACKKLFAEKEILAWIMQLAVPGFEGFTPKEIVPYIQGQPEIGSVPLLPDQEAGRIQSDNVEDSSVSEGTVFYDIRFSAAVPGAEGNVKIIINVEAQGSGSPGYPLPKRALYYCARLLSAQNGVEFTPPGYGDIKKVYSIWIVQKPPQYAENSVTTYRLREECQVGQAVARPEDYDVLQAVFIYLGGYRAEQKDDALKLLNAIRSEELSEGELRDILEKNFHIAMTKKVDTEVEEVCNWSSALLERGVEKGRQQGWEGGRQEGRQEGILAQMLKVFLKQIAKGLSFEEAADTAGAETPSEIEYLRQHLPARS